MPIAVWWSFLNDWLCCKCLKSHVRGAAHLNCKSWFSTERLEHTDSHHLGVCHYYWRVISPLIPAAFEAYAMSVCRCHAWYYTCLVHGCYWSPEYCSVCCWPLLIYMSVLYTITSLYLVNSHLVASFSAETSSLRIYLVYLGWFIWL